MVKPHLVDRDADEFDRLVLCAMDYPHVSHDAVEAPIPRYGYQVHKYVHPSHPEMLNALARRADNSILSYPAKPLISSPLRRHSPRRM